jgi:hypothetical protein
MRGNVAPNGTGPADILPDTVAVGGKFLTLFGRICLSQHAAVGIGAVRLATGSVKGGAWRGN